MANAEPVPQDVVDGLRRLRLATIRAQAAEVLQTARTQRWPPEDVLRTLIAAEIAGRDLANRQIRLKQAGFPATKTLDSFDVAASSIPRPTFDYLASLEWIRATENLLLVGPTVIAAHYLSLSIGIGE
jgi:DNA replication protein DnaC